MKKSALIISFLALISLSSIANSSPISQTPKSVSNWAKTLPHKQEKLTKIHFYFHRLGGAAPSGVVVARANATTPTSFGLTVVRDDPLTAGPELSSARIGYAQGLSVSASLEEVILVDYFTLSFSGAGAGGTLAVLGSNAIFDRYRELPIVGGTGDFRLARGIITFQTYFFNATTREATVEADAVVFHF